MVTTDVERPASLPEWPFRLIPLRGIRIFDRPLPFALLTLLREVKAADVVHIHTPFPVAEFLASLIARMHRKRTVVTYHMDAISPHAGRGRLGRLLEQLYDRVSLRPALKRADAIATNGLLYVDYSRVLPSFRSKVVAVHQGVRDERLAQVDGRVVRARLVRDARIAGSPVILGFVGRLVPYKGMDVGIRGFARAVRGGCDAQLFIGGRGPEMENLKRIAREEGVEKRVHFLGFVADEDLPLFLAAVDIVISPSVSPLESTPITLLEAMAQGTAVIGTEVGGTAESVVPGGWNRIVRAGDADELRTAILDLARQVKDSPKRPRFGRSWRDVAIEYLALFRGGRG